MMRAGLLVLLAVAVAVALAAQVRGTPHREGTMEEAMRVLRAEVASGRTPAVQYRHFTADSMILAYDDGVSDVRSGVPVGPRTSFHGLSITKTATAVAVLQLVDRGLVALDAPAATYLSDFPYGGAVTVRQLLAHTGGLPNPLPLRWIHPADTHSDFEERAFFDDVFARSGRARRAPGARVRYSNLGYVLLGRLVEQVSGESYESYVATHVLAPLGLEPAALGFRLDPAHHATGHHQRRSISRLLLAVLLDTSQYLAPAHGRWQTFRPYQVNGAAYGGLLGTADGFARYGQALLGPAGGLLSEPSRLALFTETPLGDGRPSGMTLAWFAGELNGHGWVAHAGGGGGYYAELRLYPGLGRGSVVFFNRSGFSDARFLDAVDRALLPPRVRAGKDPRRTGERESPIQQRIRPRG
jgi:D-alanyl-D-alanine carboxypeptidase